MSHVEDMTGRVAIVTGGAQGIGQAAAELMADYGASIVIADLKIAQAQAVADGIIQKGGQALAVELNVLYKDSVDAMVEKTLARFGKIDVLVNSAGIVDATPIPEMTVEQWDIVVDVDLRGTHLCMQAVLPNMMENKYGRIVNLSSQAGQLGGWKASVNYSAAKGGVIAITKAYARFAGPYGITVNCVAPGFIETEMTKGRGDSPEGVPLARLGTALDCAKAIYFLSSDLAPYTTGSSVDVNGGYLMR